MKVYLLFEDNGQDYDGASIDVIGVYEDKIYAETVASIFNLNRDKPIFMSEDEWLKSEENDGSITYEEYAEHEQNMWLLIEGVERQYVKEFELITKK
jgi:hypothetical protein